MQASASGIGVPWWGDATQCVVALAVTAAILVSLVRSRDKHLVAPLLASTMISAWWVVLFLLVEPAADPSDSLLQSRAAWIALIAVLAAGSGAGTVAQGFLRERRRQTAWPNHLARLLEDYPDWPAFRATVGVALLAVLLIGCAFTTSWLTAPCALAGAAAQFTLVHRRWNPTGAKLAAGLLTLAAVALPMPFFATGPNQELAETMPVLLNVALFALAYMTLHWHWVAGVWDQQLLDGVPWTTTGRLIPTARRAGFFSAVFALLAACQMALWPEWGPAVTDDDSIGRWVAGLGGIGALTAALILAALMTQKRSLVGLMILAVAIAGMFIGVRIR